MADKEETPKKPAKAPKAEKPKLDPVAARILSLESKLQGHITENGRLRRELKDATVKNGVFQAMREELECVVTPLEEFDPIPNARKDTRDTVEEHLVMHISDAHADETVKAHQVANLESYDFPTALCRAEKYVDSVIKFTQQTLANYRFPVLHILSYGDMTSGEIHGSVSHSYYRNMMRNSLAIGQMQALMIRDLAPYFEQVKVICLPGNHGRRSTSKDFNGPWDNWDYLISETSATYCRDLKNVEFAIPECFSLVYDINGHGFHIQHGDDIKGWNGIPWYGIERKTRRLVSLHNSMGVNAKYFVLGHFHAMASMADLKGETFVNGAWVATNPYSYESFSGYREPMQLIHGVHKERGVTWRLPVLLKDAAKEKQGPSRYSVILANEAMAS